MSNSYEAWADAFHFSEDLKNLEQFYHQQHQELLEEQAKAESQQTVEAESPEKQNEDMAFLKMLSEQIAHRLSSELAQPDTLAEYFKINELQHDNVTMAKQIQTLLERLNALESENRSLKQKETQYQKLFGSLYIKIS